jgi:hypothetical protein
LTIPGGRVRGSIGRESGGAKGRGADRGTEAEGAGSREAGKAEGGRGRQREAEGGPGSREKGIPIPIDTNSTRRWRKVFRMVAIKTTTKREALE